MNIAVIGHGFMGSGIVETIFTQTDHRILWVKMTEGDKFAAPKKLEEKMRARCAKGKLSQEKMEMWHHKVFPYVQQLDRLEHCDLIIESIVEDLTEKQKLFKVLDDIMDSDTVFATNTSTLSVSEVTNNRPRSCGLHFFSPVPAMKLVEVVSTDKLDSYSLDKVIRFVDSLNKKPIVVNNTPGFVVNRLLTPVMLNAIRLMESGMDKESIDSAMKLGCSHPMGPLELADFIGLDVVLAMANSLYGELKEEQYKAPKTLIELVDKGNLGRKTQKGLYGYKNS